MATKKAVATRAVVKKATAKPKPVNPLANNAAAIMRAHNLIYSNGFFRTPATILAFYGEASRLPGSCAVIELRAFHDLSRTDYTAEELIELFKFSIEQTLTVARRRQALATITQQQAEYTPLFKAAGFVSLGAAKNPDSGNTVTIWALSI